MNEKLNNWLWADIAHKVAVWLICAGVTRQRWLLRILVAIAPSLVGLAIGLEEMYRPSNSVLWIYEPDEGDDDSEVDYSNLLGDINEIIERAPTPFGMDNFVIVIERRASLPGDANNLSFEYADATLHQRACIGQTVLRGNRWKDWKRGNSKQELLDAFAKTTPTLDASVTLIRAAVMGRSMERLAVRFAEGGGRAV